MTNFERYKELKQQHRVLVTYTPPKDLSDWDVVIQCLGPGYAHARYRIIKNSAGLSTNELALICDGGNLCFGYRMSGDEIYVYTD